MNIWVVMITVGVLTFLTRLSFIALLHRLTIAPAFLRALRFVPIAVLSAIIAPDLAGYNNVALDISLTNPRLLAGIAATGVAFLTKNVVWTIVAGMLTFWLLKLWL